MKYLVFFIFSIIIFTFSCSKTSKSKHVSNSELSRENDSLTGEQRHFQREDKKIITELKIKNKKSNPSNPIFFSFSMFFGLLN